MRGLKVRKEFWDRKDRREHKVRKGQRVRLVSRGRKGPWVSIGRERGTTPQTIQLTMRSPIKVRHGAQRETTTMWLQLKATTGPSSRTGATTVRAVAPLPTSLPTARSRSRIRRRHQT